MPGYQSHGMLFEIEGEQDGETLEQCRPKFRIRL